jgi:hypothetical protein
MDISLHDDGGRLDPVRHCSVSTGAGSTVVQSSVERMDISHHDDGRLDPVRHCSVSTGAGPPVTLDHSSSFSIPYSYIGAYELIVTLA